MHGKRRELNEVGVMGRVTMKGWSVGCNERQMGGETENIGGGILKGRGWAHAFCFAGNVTWQRT